MTGKFDFENMPKKSILIIAQEEKIISFLGYIEFLSSTDINVDFIAIFKNQKQIFHQKFLEKHSNIKFFFTEDISENNLYSELNNYLNFEKYYQYIFIATFKDSFNVISQIIGEKINNSSQKDNILLPATTIFQCMMQGVCGQCYIKSNDTKSNSKIIFSCLEQFQKYNNINMDNIHTRNKQNSLLEKLST